MKASLEIYPILVDIKYNLPNTFRYHRNLPIKISPTILRYLSMSRACIFKIYNFQNI